MPVFGREHDARSALVMCCLAVLLFDSGTHAMNLARQKALVDMAIETYGVSGQGVTIAILDRGIDWTHPDFINEDGTTRIKYLLDMSNQDECSVFNPDPVEFTAEDINAALAGGPPIDSRDAVGHGTVTAGAAAGNGTAFADGKYRGVAPNADLIIIKVVSEGAPAHDGQPAETGFQGCYLDAFDWLDEKIDELGQPCVAFINAGRMWGPVDGTSVISEKIDEAFGDNRPGRVYISPAGNEEGFPTRAGGTFDDRSITAVPFVKSSSDSVFIQMWYDGSHPANITVSLAGGTVLGPLAPGESESDGGGLMFHYAPGDEFYPWASSSGDHAVWLRINGHVGPGTIRFQGIEPGEATFDVYAPGFDLPFEFTSMLKDGTLTDYSTTLSAIVTGTYVVRTSYSSMQGTIFVGSEGGVNQRWIHSATGPTRDGRVHGVDLCSPGQNIFAAYAPDSYYAAFGSRLVSDGGGMYGLLQGTSGASPILAGVSALLLEVDPTLTSAQVREALRATAFHDVHTGNEPSAEWGFGKINALAAVEYVLNRSEPCVDLTDDGVVGPADLAQLLGAWGPCDPPSPDRRGPGGEALCSADFTGDGCVGPADLAQLLGSWGPCPL